nr:immunoglobulin light chain junction region [Macaca mulatta]
CQQGNGYPFTF